MDIGLKAVGSERWGFGRPTSAWLLTLAEPTSSATGEKLGKSREARIRVWRAISAENGSKVGGGFCAHVDFPPQPARSTFLAFNVTLSTAAFFSLFTQGARPRAYRYFGSMGQTARRRKGSQVTGYVAKSHPPKDGMCGATMDGLREC